MQLLGIGWLRLVSAVAISTAWLHVSKETFRNTEFWPYACARKENDELHMAHMKKLPLFRSTFKLVTWGQPVLSLTTCQPGRQRRDNNSPCNSWQQMMSTPPSDFMRLKMPTSLDCSDTTFDLVVYDPAVCAPQFTAPTVHNRCPWSGPTCVLGRVTSAALACDRSACPEPSHEEDVAPTYAML